MSLFLGSFSGMMEEEVVKRLSSLYWMHRSAIEDFEILIAYQHYSKEVRKGSVFLLLRYPPTGRLFIQRDIYGLDHGGLEEAYEPQKSSLVEVQGKKFEILVLPGDPARRKVQREIRKYLSELEETDREQLAKGVQHD